MVSRHPAPRAWVVRTALNTRVSWWRRRHHEVPLAQAEMHADRDGTYEGGVGAELMAAVLRLPLRQRQVVALRIFLDLDTARHGPGARHRARYRHRAPGPRPRGAARGRLTEPRAGDAMIDRRRAAERGTGVLRRSPAECVPRRHDPAGPDATGPATPGWPGRGHRPRSRSDRGRAAFHRYWPAGA